jgi:hypothetical protein
MALVEEGRGKHAVTHYRTLAPLDEAALVECRLETGGRTRCAFTLRQSAMRYWAILYMDARPPGFGRFFPGSVSAVRRCTRPSLDSSTRSAASRSTSPARRPSICGN